MSPTRGPQGAGLAIFVKTPGLSPIKTRLAAGVGEDAALTFFRLAAAATGAVAREAQALAGARLTAYWAVAEAAGQGQWPGLPVVAQGEGGLGERLDHVYASLRARHGAALLIGADSPQLTPEDLLQALAALDAPGDFALGPTPDGGFWVFGGRLAIARADWLAVPYSAADTAERLAGRLAGRGRLTRLAARVDVDEASDLAALAADLAALNAPLPAQLALRAWLEALLAAQPPSQA